METCVPCGGTPSTSTYVLVEHSPSKIRTRRKDLIRRVVEPYELQVCSPCLARIQLQRRRARLVAGVALAGIVVASGYLVGGLLGAPRPIILGLLFGGFGVFAVGAVLVVVMQRALVASLPIEANRGRNILLVTTDPAELERELDRLRLASAEIRNDLDRARSDAQPLPAARIRVPR